MNRYAHCHFCDDIRLEMGNKTSLIGLYAGEMFLPVFPTVLPKLCFTVLCTTDAKEPFKSLSVRISDSSQVLVEQTLPLEALQEAFEQSKNMGTKEDPIQQISIGLNLTASPFVIQKETSITVTVNADGDELLAGKLRVKQGSQADSDVGMAG